ncbi:MAG TPA: cyclic nucleotide-binding domain-containing protein [Actinomycetota bacterium]
MEHPETAATLMRAELFEGLDPRVVDQVAGIAERRSIPAGQHVFFEGDIATEFYVVASGSVRVYIPSRGEELNAAIVRDGQMFGEGGLLDGGPRVASALALEPTTLLAVRREPWLALTRSEPTLALRVFSAFGAALRSYVGHMVDSLFLDVEIPDAPPPSGEEWPASK